MRWSQLYSSCKTSFAPRRGWGLVAVQPVQKGQLLVQVPAAATMSAASASECDIVGPIAAAGGLNDWQVCRWSQWVEPRTPSFYSVGRLTHRIATGRALQVV